MKKYNISQHENGKLFVPMVDPVATVIEMEFDKVEFDLLPDLGSGSGSIYGWGLTNADAPKPIQAICFP